jgi:hypothetical protein
MLKRLPVALAWTVLMFVRLSSTAAEATPATPPPVDIVIERMVERSRVGFGDNNGLHHTWRRFTVVEELDSRGQVEKRKTKEHQVVGRGSVQEARLVKVDGREIPEKELRREGDRERDNRSRYAQRGGRKGNLELDEALIRRFRYQWLSNAVVDGRPNHILAFTPASAQDTGKIADRIIGQLAGRIWVDEQTFEVSRIEAQNLKRVTFGAFLVELSRIRFEIDRRPVAGGVWVNTRLDSQIEGRKLFDRFGVRMDVVQEGFEAVDGDKGQAGGDANR